MESRTPTYVFNLLAATGFFLLFATVVPAAVSPSIHRSNTWFSMIISWMVYAASYMLILGHQLGQGICGLQMLFIYACPPLTAISDLAFIVDVHLRIKNALFSSRVDHKYTPVLLAIPWALFAAVAVEALIAVRDFSEIHRDPNHMYCHSIINIQTQITAIICVLGLGTALGLIIWTSIILYRNWVLVFTLMTSTGLGLGAYVTGQGVGEEGLAIWSALLPILPVLCGIAFGTQKDIVYTA